MLVTEENFGREIVAEVTVLGMDERCPAVANDHYSVIIDPGPILVDELVIDPQAPPIERLLIVAEEHANNKTNQLYIIDYVLSVYSEFEIAERHRLIKDLLVERGRVPRASITIVAAIADEPSTRLYRVPPGVSNP